ncbi:MAG: uracil-DNA glycosylase [Chloroflexi bacterium]|nr:uracil-DNA glycosylase [Chloroflexota bacterium]
MSGLDEVRQEIERCRACALAESRLKTVPGEGDERADLMFIGEAPGWHENQQGRPFVGAAGQFLDELLALIGLKRAEVYIANVVKCRPPANRDPLPEEITACQKFLDRQIELIAPQMIVTLGRFSMARYFPGEKISRIHGIPRKRDDVIYFPVYHPAAALRSNEMRVALEADIRKIPKLLADASRLAENRKREVAEQLTLF